MLQFTRQGWAFSCVVRAALVLLLGGAWLRTPVCGSAAPAWRACLLCCMSCAVFGSHLLRSAVWLFTGIVFAAHLKALVVHYARRLIYCEAVLPALSKVTLHWQRRVCVLLACAGS
jgi:hypothetical protein